VWEPMLEELKKKSGGKITSTMYAGAALGAGPPTMISFPKACRTWAISQRPGHRKIPPNRCALSRTWVDGKDIATEMATPCTSESSKPSSQASK